MKIVMLGPFGLAPKGTMRARALPAARALQRRGHEVTLVMPPWHTPEQAGRRWLDPESGVALEYLPLSGRMLPLVGHLWIALRMARRALAWRPDVIHAFKPKAYSGLAAALIWFGRRRTHGPAIVIDSDDWEGPGGWNEVESYSRLQRRFFAWQECWGLGHCDAVTVASRALETLVWALGVPPARVTYLPNALAMADTGWPRSEAQAATADAFGDRPAADLSRPPTLLLYTRFFEFDLRRLLEVLAGLRQQHPAVQLVVVGRGLFGEEKRLLDLAEQLGLQEAIDYRGWLEVAQLGRAFAAADVALYPFDDTLINRTKSSVKLLELMGAGLAVVADAVGQNAVVIEDGRSGLLVRPDSVDDWVAAVSRLLADAELRRRLGAAARRRVAEHFNWSRQVATLESVYERALQRRKGGRRDGRGVRLDSASRR